MFRHLVCDGRAVRPTPRGNAVRKQADVPAYIDGFMVVGFTVIAGLLLRLLLSAPPAQPASER